MLELSLKPLIVGLAIGLIIALYLLRHPFARKSRIDMSDPSTPSSKRRDSPNAGPLNGASDAVAEMNPDPHNLLSVRGKSILMVEDNPEIRVFVGRFIRYFGVNVEFADNGSEGVEKAMAGSYDVVLMDLMMPVCGGIEATWRLRSAGYRGSVIAVTGQEVESGRECYEALGFDDYIVKPVNRMQLLYAIALHASRWHRPAASDVELSVGSGQVNQSLDSTSL